MTTNQSRNGTQRVSSGTLIMNQDDRLMFFGGVFANFHETRRSASLILEPATSSKGTALLISSISSFVSFTLTELTFSSRFLILVVPIMSNGL
ncbi:hypothetical protein Hanom_Chr07g00597561 [Helianthus anomalus]